MTDIKQSIDEIVAEVATKGMIGMQLAMSDGDSKHHEKVLQEARELITTLFTQLLDEVEHELIGQDEPGITNVMIAMEHAHQSTKLNNLRTKWLGSQGE